MRIGTGWDIHRLEKNRKLFIGGVEIPSELGCIAHSDGDVLTHALIDALLGAAALGDIGMLFPDSDVNYKDAFSMDLLLRVITLIRKSGYRIINIDATVILEKPKLRPYIDEIRESIAVCIGIDVSAVSVKAKTAEGLGAVGEGEAIEARAVVLIQEG